MPLKRQIGTFKTVNMTLLVTEYLERKLRKMLIRLLCIMVVLRGAAGSELVDVFGGVSGENRMFICIGGRGSETPLCEGALWRPRWVIARASCLNGVPISRAYVQPNRPGASCLDHFKYGRMPDDASRIRRRTYHPEYVPGVYDHTDAVMIGVERIMPVLGAPWPPNSSDTYEMIDKLKPWMEEVYETLEINDNPYELMHQHTHFLVSTPLRLFCMTVIVPSMLFAALFIYVIFYTGCQDEIPYNTIAKDESETLSEYSVKFERAIKIEEDDLSYSCHDFVLDDPKSYEDENFQYDPCCNPWGI